MAGFTKGPWNAVPTDPSEGVDCWWLIGADKRDIGTVNGGQGDETPQANARLIAAAPELFEALEALEYQLGGETDAVKRRFADTRVKARAALAKAKGEQP